MAGLGAWFSDTIDCSNLNSASIPVFEITVQSNHRILIKEIRLTSCGDNGPFSGYGAILSLFYSNGAGTGTLIDASKSDETSLEDIASHSTCKKGGAGETLSTALDASKKILALTLSMTNDSWNWFSIRENEHIVVPEGSYLTMGGQFETIGDMNANIDFFIYFEA